MVGQRILDRTIRVNGNVCFPWSPLMAGPDTGCKVDRSDRDVPHQTRQRVGLMWSINDTGLVHLLVPLTGPTIAT